jgi:hypothetical protein
MVFSGWCLEPDLNRHAPFQEAADFKSAVSTNFTIEAGCVMPIVKQNSPGNAVAGADHLEARPRVELG